MPNNTPTRKIAIVGLGLLGASLAEVLRLKFPKDTLIGVSSEHTLQKALKADLIDEGYEYEAFSQWKPFADLIFLCTPMEHIQSFMQNLADCPLPFAKDCIITDVGSAKTEICAAGERLFEHQATFVGSHPMAGSEKSGFEARSAILYENALWILCADEERVAQKARLLLDILKGMNVRLVYLDAPTHDRYMARISHIPQLVSTTLSHSIRRTPEAPGLSGPGFRDMTRLAASPLWMWEPILKGNRTEILEGLKDFSADIQSLLQTLEAENWKELGPLFSSAQEIRESIPLLRHSQEREGFPILVSLPDKPGVLNKVLEPIAQAQLNFSDIELLKNREGLGGTLRLVFDGLENAQKAVELILGLSVQARLQ